MTKRIGHSGRNMNGCKEGRKRGKEKEGGREEKGGSEQGKQGMPD